jgi:SAM-dependent methyltransferase
MLGAGGRAQVNVIADRWDAEYRAGRYADDTPIPFVETILATLERHPDLRVGVGLYVGCGNGRNYLPLVDAGLRLTGLDVSLEALAQLTTRRPAVAERIVCGDFRDFGGDTALDYLIAIQVFQHGGDDDVGAYFARAAALLKPGGLLFARTNSAATEVYHRHTVEERNRFGGFTVRYAEGPKRDLLVHFATREELLDRTAAHFTPLVEPIEERIRRTPPKTGSWAQWEAMWRRR